MGFFTVDISGLETLENELKEEVEKIESYIPNALKAVGSDMTYNLQQHIQNDFYDKYTPNSYPRRVAYPQFGTPIISSDYMDADVNGNTLSFEYFPRGEHSGTLKDTLDWNEEKAKKGNISGNRPIKPNPVHGDALINRLQTGKGYDWKVSEGDYPQRPFWDNFVDDELSGRRCATVFFANLSYPGINSDTTDLIFDTNEGKLGQLQATIFENDDEEELPF